MEGGSIVIAGSGDSLPGQEYSCPQVPFRLFSEHSFPDLSSLALLGQVGSPGVGSKESAKILGFTESSQGMGALAHFRRLVNACGQDGLNDIIGYTRFGKGKAQALAEEIHNFRTNGVQGLCQGEFALIKAVCLSHQSRQRQGQFFLQDEIANSLSLATQGIRVLGAGRNEIGDKTAADYVDFVRQGHQDAFFGMGEGIPGKARLVMLADGLGHSLFFPGRQGIFPPHYSLKFGEFVDHLGDQVRFRQAGRPLSPGLDPGFCPEMLGQPTCQAN